MEFYEVVKKRRTVRDFKDKPVDMEVIKRILSAGLQAPTNDHLRNWEFVIITDKSEKEKLLKPIPKKMTEKRLDFIINTMRLKDQCQRDMYYNAIPKQYSMLTDAACLILPFYRQHKPFSKLDTLNSMNSFASIWCCIENIFLAATAEGLACAMRIPMAKESNHLAEIIGNPADYVMPCFISIGYPADEVDSIEQKKVRVEDKIHINRW